MIPFYYIHYIVDLQFHNTFTMPFCKLQEKSKKRIGKKTFVGVDIEEMQVHNNSLCLFVFLSNDVKLKKNQKMLVQKLTINYLDMLLELI